MREKQTPDRVSAMVLGAVTTGTAAEIAWITESMRRVFPREWDDFAAGIPERHRDLPPAAAYARLFVDPDPTVRAEAARSWCTCEDTHVSLLPGWVPNPRYEDPDFRNVFSRLVSHYWSNDCFLADRPLLAHIDRLDGVPATLLHSRYDVSSPLDIAWDLARSWPTSRLVVLDDAGHGGGSFADEFTAEVGEFGAAHARPLPSSRP